MEIEEARRLGTALMKRHGLRGWHLVLDNAKTRAGICRSVPREIGLSRVLTALHPEAEVRDTILHEIAHALVSPAHGHDAVWRAKALEIGCTARRCVSSTVPRPVGPWVGTCPSGHRTTRHRRPTRVQSCGYCSRGFDPRSILEWTWNGRRVAMDPSYDAERRGILERQGEVPLSESAVAARATRPGRAAISKPAASILGVGARVRLGGRGKYAGRVGRVTKIGRSRYHVQVRGALLTAPFTLVDPC